jgi:uncharacterized membrane protein YcfT
MDARGNGRRPVAPERVYDARESQAPSRESNRPNEGRIDARDGQAAGFRQDAWSEREPNGVAAQPVEEALPQRSRGGVWNRGSSEGGRGPAPERPERPGREEQPSPRSSEAFWSQIESSRQAPPQDRAPHPDVPPRPDVPRSDVPQRDEGRFDQRPVLQSREQREQREQLDRARDASDAMWLKDLARPETPRSLFKPQQPPRDPQPQGYYGPRDPNQAYQQEHQQQYQQQQYQQQYQPSMPPGGERPPNHPEQAGQPGKKQRLAWIDTARGLAIILVVFIHATQWVQEAPIRIGVWDDINEVVSTLRMPLFFMCAGILATKWLYASWADLIAKKVFFLGWVFVIWQVVGSFEALVAARITGDQLTPMRMLVSLALSPARPRFELWFIWALAIFFVVTRLTSRFPLAPQLAVGALMASVAFSNLIPEVNLGWNGFLKYYLFFVIGSYYRPLLLTLANRLTKPLALAATGGWLAIATGTYVTGLIYLPGVGLVVRLFGLVAGIGVALLLQNIKLFSYLGSRTLPIFLAHTPLLVLMVFVLDQVATSGAVQAIKWFLPILLTVPAIYLALVLNRVALKTPARVFYEPPAQATELVRNTIANQRGGAEKMNPSLVPGLHERPFDRQLERALA